MTKETEQQPDYWELRKESIVAVRQMLKRWELEGWSVETKVSKNDKEVKGGS